MVDELQAIFRWRCHRSLSCSLEDDIHDKLTAIRSGVAARASAYPETSSHARPLCPSSSGYRPCSYAWPCRVHAEYCDGQLGKSDCCTTYARASPNRIFRLWLDARDGTGQLGSAHLDVASGLQKKARKPFGFSQGMHGLLTAHRC